MEKLKAVESCLFKGQRLHERGFICNRIENDAVTPTVYTAPIENVGQTGSI